MPFPLIPLIAVGITTGLVALSLKKSFKAKDSNANTRKDTFAKYATDHRVRERSTETLSKLRELKMDICNRELKRFAHIFENILHHDLAYENPFIQEIDFRPVISSAPLQIVDILGGTGEWFIAGLSQFQTEMKKSNHELQRVVLESGFDFRKYSPSEKAIVINAFYLALSLVKGMKIPLVEENGELRETAIDEFEELIIDRLEGAVA